MVGDHVRRKPDPPRPRTVPQLRVGAFAAEVVGDPVVAQAVRRRDRLRVAHHPLDPRGRLAPLPEADEPEPGDPTTRETVELLVRDRVECPDVAFVCPGELVEPDVRALRHEDKPWHPVLVHAESLGLVGPAAPEPPERGRVGAAATVAVRGHPPQPLGALLLGEDVERHDEAVEIPTQQQPPAIPDEAELARERVRRGDRRRTEHLDERLGVRPEGGTAAEVVGDGVHHLVIGGGRRELAIVEELPERPERRVEVREPEECDLLEDDRAVRGPVRAAIEIRRGVHVAAVHGERRERVGEGPERRLESLGADA